MAAITICSDFGAQKKIKSDTVSTVSPSISQSCPTLSYTMGWSTQSSLSITNSQSLLKLMFIKLVMPPNNFIFPFPLCLLPLIFPSIGVFSNESVLPIRWPKYWRLASASVLPVNIQNWLPLGGTGWISLQSKGLSRVLSITTVQKHQFFSVQPCLWSNSHIHTWLLEKP